MLTRWSLFLFLLFACVSVSVSQTDFEKGRNHYEKGEYEKAIEYFTKSIDSPDVGLKPRPILGMSYVKLKRYDLANRTFKSRGKSGTHQLRKSNSTYKRIKFLSRLSAIGSEIDTKNMPAGVTKFAIEFNKNGKVTYVYPYETVNEAMTKMLVRALGKVKFEPARQNGRKITVIRMVSYRFSKI